MQYYHDREVGKLKRIASEHRRLEYNTNSNKTLPGLNSKPWAKQMLV